VWVVLEEPADEVGGQPEDGPDRKVHVAGDDHEGFADGEQDDESCAGQELLDAVLVGEGVVVHRRDREDDDDHDGDAKLARSQQLLGPAETGDRTCRRGGGGHAAGSAAVVMRRTPQPGRSPLA
jgi:hypothetical protein